MFGLGLGECALIFILVLLIFGPGFLTRGAKRIGGSFTGFQQSLRDARDEAST